MDKDDIVISEAENDPVVPDASVITEAEDTPQFQKDDAPSVSENSIGTKVECADEEIVLGLKDENLTTVTCEQPVQEEGEIQPCDDDANGSLDNLELAVSNDEENEKQPAGINLI